MKLKLRGDAREIYRAIRRKIESEIRVSEAKRFLDNFEPVSDVGEILKRQNYLKRAMESVSEEVEGLLLKVKPIKFRKEFLGDRLLVVSEDEVEEAEKLGLCMVSTEPIEGYDIVLSTIGYGIDVELKPYEIAPELYIKPLWESRDVLEALARIFPGGAAAKILRELEGIEDVMRRNERLENIEEIIRRYESELNKRIEEKLERFKLTLSGKELVEFLRSLRYGDVEAILSKFSSLNDDIIEEIRKAEEKLSQELGVAIEVFPRDYPVEVPPDVVERLKRSVERELKIELYMRAREIVPRIIPYIQGLKEEIERAYELEFILALKRFSRGFTFPKIEEGGIGFIKGRNLFIENPQPVSYFVGSAKGQFKGIQESSVVILTGANSGGKTSLLELMLQIVILAHMGLPVPASEAWVEPLDEVFFFKRKRINYGAGAFESSLKSIVKALKGKGRKLILIDEFEAITEPGAAAKILAELLKIGVEKGFYIVIVSHLGEDLKKELPYARVDGIEASGLDEELNLIVDRQPKFGVIGKSTPELILERLARKGRGEEREILMKVLAKLNNTYVPTQNI
ncbi:MutS-related protein [Pyrococcus abyssi]|uniref:DNA-binding protein MutS2 n=1 Tax=Pyrococcus abyssi (strain GE5 / Orsay) TaxID=272844 RepID=Q9UYB7_PYRAB|nr:endonuclease MutS2 [Pyrococcus abyssi]CAB50495.1 mutS-like DNA mismatch recognition protein, muts2 homolog [Pyrococcus abyssi GE5]CCE71050.1 TPA: DNA mismatch recognition protein MutS [Pyrococcus abyssi GE5]